MAGMSRRFTEAGYSKPKYMLEAHGKTLFSHAVGSFERYFKAIPFLFIARDIQFTKEFIQTEVSKLGIIDFKIVILPRETSGQAETVALGLEYATVDEFEPITIFNIDTFRPNFEFPTNFDINEVDGYLEVFQGNGSNWSYVRADPRSLNKVIETAEKVPISNLCCTGLYHFKYAMLFKSAYLYFSVNGMAQFRISELFVAPMYNILIKNNYDIRYEVINKNQVLFCGVPSEYLDFININ